MKDNRLRTARIVSSVAAMAIALACGTNYVYSAWAPQFAERLHLSATESNLIGVAGNLGMYSLGIPIGMFIDRHGPRPAVLLGAILLGLGYFPFKASYETATGAVPWLCFFSYLTGLGSCMAFSAAIKTSALNWPHHRGTATAFPLASFGLSAFFFSTCGGILFPSDTSDFLMLLSVSTFAIPFVGFFFLRVWPHEALAKPAGANARYHALPTGPVPDNDKSRPGARGNPNLEPGTSSDNDRAAGAARDSQELDIARAGSLAAASSGRPSSVDGTPGCGEDVESAMPTGQADANDADSDADSLLSKTSSLPGEVLVQSSVDMDRSHRVDIQGWRLLREPDFYYFFSIMGILGGIGLMTINNIGHDANALWKKWDDSVSEDFLVKHQRMHVSILSIFSFTGRLLSGVGSDIVKSFHANRAWCLVVAAAIFALAQTCALLTTNPHLLGLVSGLTGLGYGVLYGVFPSAVAETFGIHGLSQNWGFIIFAPVVSSNLFNLIYGSTFDNHSVVGRDGENTCLDGLACYQAAYSVALAAALLGVLVTLGLIRHQRVVRIREERAENIAVD